MSTRGPGLFRSALLFESAANIGSVIPFILAPETVLSYFVRGPSQITPATKSLMQWLGAMVVVATAPLILAYPEPTRGEPPYATVARRRVAYLTLGAGELALGSVALGQYLTGDSGITDTALLSTVGAMATFLGWRAYCLVVKPELMDAATSAGKAD